MLDLNDVYYYAQVVEHQGITAAARALNVPKFSISRHHPIHLFGGVCAVGAGEVINEII